MFETVKSKTKDALGNWQDITLEILSLDPVPQETNPRSGKRCKWVINIVTSASRGDGTDSREICFSSKKDAEQWAQTVTKKRRDTMRDTIKKAEKLFDQSADAWLEGNNSGNSETLAECEKAEQELAEQGEKLLQGIGISVDWPGLYPTYQYKEHTFYTADSLITWIEREVN